MILSRRVAKKGLVRLNLNHFTCCALFSWEPRQSDFLSAILLAIKGENHERLWQYFSEKFTQSFAVEELTQMRVEAEEETNNIQQGRTFPFLAFQRRKIVLIPCPSKGKRPDHAYFFAHYLSKCLGGELRPLIHHPNGFLNKTSQRNKEKKDRKSIKFERTAYEEPDKENTIFVFVDDILTTGSTAIAAYKALGCPRHFQAWVLAYRKPSCYARSQ